MSEFPDFKEELERKASETLAEALQQLSEGETTPETALAVLRALWGTCAGLVSKELMEMIAEATDAIEVSPKPRLRLFQKLDNMVVLEVPNEVYTSTHLLKGKLAQSIRVTDHDMTFKEAIQRHNKVVSKCISEGYHE